MFLLGAALGVLGLAFWAAGNIYDYEDTVSLDALPDVQVIVCPVGGRGRIRAATDLWYQYWVSRNPKSKPPVLFISGASKEVTTRTLLQQARKETAHAIARNTDQMILEARSSNTEENAREFSQEALRRGWTRILLVTSSYHMKRAKRLFEHQLDSQSVLIETFSVRQEPFQVGLWWKDPLGVWVTLIEFFKGLRLV